MSEIAIQVDQLGKCYELGELVTFKKAVRKLAGPLGLAKHVEPNLFWALKDVSFELRRGEVLGVIGRNGAGKSTLLKVLSRITAPSAGRALINGRVGSLLEVGTGFHPELTGRENVYLNGAILGMKKREIDAKFDEIVSFAETEKFIDTPVKRYSSGMRVRLAFAVAAHLEPEILICDEVLAVGDAAFQAKCLGKMGDVAKQGRTVLLVSHNMASIQALCSECLVLNQGAVDFQGNPVGAISCYLQQTISNAYIPPAQRTDREGGLDIKLTKIGVQVGEISDAPILHSGDNITIKLVFESEKEISRPTVFLGIYDGMGVQRIHFNTSLKSFNIPTFSNILHIDCHVEKLPLPPGDYSLTVAIFDGIGRMLDRLEQAKKFTVETGNFYGSGGTTAINSGQVLVDHKWSLV